MRRFYQFAASFLLSSVSLVAQRQPTRIPDPVVPTTPDHERWADKMLQSLTLEEKIGQMIEIRGIMKFYSANDPAFQKLVNDIDRYHLGAVHLTVDLDGPLLVRAQPYEAAMTVRRLQMETHGKVPLIFSADFERGPSMRLSAMEYFPHAMAFGATNNPEYAERFGKIVAEESRALGIAWNYYPIADVQINPKNPIINTRSYGGDPSQVSAMVAAYIKGSHEGGMLTTLKHFPGHGDPSITHKFRAEDEAELYVGEAGHSAPHDSVSWRRIFGASKVASEAGNFGQVQGELIAGGSGTGWIAYQLIQ